MENFLQWIEKILIFLKDYGFVNIIKSCIVIILFAFTIAIAFNPKETVSNIIELVHVIEDENHANSAEIRKHINPIINELLDNSIRDIGCDRAFIMEGHNGKANGGGLGFYYVDMTYERCRKTSLDQSIYWQYKDMPTSIFPFFNYLDEHRYFYGDLNSLSQIDSKLAQMINVNGTNFLVTVEIPGKNSVNQFMGILGYSFEVSPNLTQEQIKDYMLEVRRRVQILLSLSSLKEVNLNQFRETICLN